MVNWVYLFGAIALSLIYALPSIGDDKPVAGWVEKVRLYPGKILVDAKLDTGADTCSLHISGVTEFERDGKKWVRFEFDNSKGERVTLERKVIRTVKIKRRLFGSRRRPVINLGICLGNIYREVEVNLEDRSGFKYRMLIGRNFMEGRLQVDPALQYQLEPQCRQPGLE